MTEQQGDRTYNQAELNQAIRDALADQKADYDDLKRRSAIDVSSDARVAELQQQLADEHLRATRIALAAQHGLSDEDRDVLLTGTDEATLMQQATMLAGHRTEQQRSALRMGNVAPKEGSTRISGKDSDRAMREFASDLFRGGTQ